MSDNMDMPDPDEFLPEPDDMHGWRKRRPSAEVNSGKTMLYLTINRENGTVSDAAINPKEMCELTDDSQIKVCVKVDLADVIDRAVAMPLIPIIELGSRV